MSSVCMFIAKVFHLYISRMSDPELSDPESEGEEVLTEDILTRWTKKQLQDWLVKHHQRKS